jgi:opacity protein-like surface antigen
VNRRIDSAAARKRPVHRVWAVGLGAALLSASAFAAGPDKGKAPENTVEITPFVGQMGGGRFEDPTDNSDRDLDSGSDWGVFLNINADGPARQYEMFYAQQGTSVQGAEPFDLDVQYLHIGGIVNFTDAQPVVPYFGMTVGATHFVPSGSGLDDETRLSFSAGGGVKYLFTPHFGLRFDARAFVTLLDTESDIFCVSAPATGSSCRIKAASAAFFQYSASLGFVAAF